MTHSLNRLTVAAMLLVRVLIAEVHPQENVVPGSQAPATAVPREPVGLSHGQDMPSEDGVFQRSIVSSSIARVALEPALSADLRCRVSAFDQQLAGSGHYVQVASLSGPLVRLELRIGLGDQVVSWLEVRGTQSYWLRRHIPPAAPVLGRVDLRQLRRQMLDEQAETLQPPQGDSWVLSGGLPRLLQALDEFFEFDPPQPHELRFQPAPGESVARLPVFIVRGRWKTGYREQLTGSQEKNSGLKSLPQVPDEVELILGQPDTPFPLFPYRITFWQQQTAGQPAEPRAQRRELFSLEFFHVSRHVPSDAGLFDYAPGDQEVENLTPGYVQRLRWRSTTR